MPDTGLPRVLLLIKPSPGLFGGRRPITMPGIIALALIVIVALIVLSFALHVLFSPWLLVAVAVLAWIKFRPHRSHR